MNKFQPHIIPVYPPSNHLIFEEWFAENYKGCNTDRELLPVFFTSFFVNNDYGNDKEARRQLNDFLGTLDKSKKWFVPIQYDDGSMIDWRLFGLDVLEFNMSKQNGVMIPLLCQPHPYEFNGNKKWFANFIGSKTHPIRESVNQLIQHKDYYISFDNHPIEKYCELISQSLFTLCYRGYGANSFRVAESVQYGSIPVYISDEFIMPSWMDFEDFGVLIKAEYAHRIDEILQDIPIETIIQKQDKLSETYENFFTYEANLRHIVSHLEKEYAPTP